MDERIALVTGASRGIGAAIARYLAKDGHKVVCAARSDCSALASEVGGIGIRCDVTDAASISDLFTRIEEDLGDTVSVLVNNAGITRDRLLIALSDADWNAVLDTDLTAAMRITRRALKGMMRRRWGRVINVGSVAGLMGTPGQVGYASAKAGLIGFTKSLAKEIASREITVNLVAPGFIETSMTEEMSAMAKATAAVAIPAGRMGTPDEVAAAVGFLATPEASYVNGSVLRVDGGLG